MARPAVAQDARRGDVGGHARYPRLIGDALERFFAAPGAIGRLVVLFCVGVMLVALVWLYPQAFDRANRTARANARLDDVDRALGGGNSVLPAQGIAIEARGRIPEHGTFAVAVGAPRPGWSELAIADNFQNFMRYFLLPRRMSPDGPWILCFACDRGAHPDGHPVWEDPEQGLAILRRTS